MRPPLEAIFEKYGQEAFFAEVETNAEEKQTGLFTIFVHSQDHSTFMLLKPAVG
jgi:cellobiose-specific phosphotransferase system component IIA